MHTRVVARSRVPHAVATSGRAVGAPVRVLAPTWPGVSNGARGLAGAAQYASPVGAAGRTGSARGPTTHYYGMLNRHAPGSPGARPAAVELPFVDAVRAEHLLKLRFHLGHAARRLDKHQSGAVYGFRHNVAVFDIAKSWRSLRSLFYGLAEMAQYRSTFFLLAPNRNLPLGKMMEAVKKTWPNSAGRFNSLAMVGYADQKWIDGTFSNWKQTHAFYEKMKRLHAAKPALKTYRRFARYLRGVEGVDLMGRIAPDFMMVLATDRGAVHEANNLDIPLFGMADSNVSPRPYLYPVYGNDDSVESMQFLLDLIARAVEEGRKREHEAFATLLLQSVKDKLRAEFVGGGSGGGVGFGAPSGAPAPAGGLEYEADEGELRAVIRQMEAMVADAPKPGAAAAPRTPTGAGKGKPMGGGGVGR